MVNLVAIQMTSVPSVAKNIEFVEAQLKSLDPAKTHLVVLPECFACFGTRDGELLKIAEEEGSGPIQDSLKALARQYHCNIITGTFPLRCDTENKFTASSLFINEQGEVTAHYQKIHLFDVAVSDNTGSYRESKYTRAGDKVITVQTPFGNVGMAVCYDVRFPGLFTAMGDVDIIVLPSAFTKVTGAAHWHTLVRARAIEKQCFVVAANQTGVHANKRETFGHSVIYSPWGETLAELPEETGYTQCEVDIATRQKVKESMPVFTHNRFRSDFV